MTAADLRHAPGDTYEERLANTVAALEECIATGERVDPVGPPEDDSDPFEHLDARRNERKPA